MLTVSFVTVQRVYAVAYRLPLQPNAPDARPDLDIGGGTGFACQLYVDRFSHQRKQYECPHGECVRGEELGQNAADDEGEGPEEGSLCELYFYDDGSPGWSGCLIDPATHRR